MRTPELTSRLQRFGTTVFSEFSALALQHRAVNLGQGFPDFDPPEALAQAAQSAIAEGRNQYAPGDGVSTLRKAIAGHATAHHGLAYDPDREVTVTTGATEAVYVALAALCDVGDEVVLIEPWYDSYRAAAAMAGAAVRTVPLRFTGDGWHLDGEDLQAVASPATRVIVLNSPHNPTGKVFDAAELEAIAQVAAEHDAVIVADEVYEHLDFKGKHRSICHVPGAKDRTVRISSAAKTFSVTGWKVGWACAPPHLTDAVRLTKQWTTFTSGTPFQHAVAQALGWHHDYYDAQLAAYRRRRDLLCEGLANAGFAVVEPDGTFFAATDIRPLGFDDDVRFCRRLPAEVGVGAIPISVFHDDARDGRGFVRFAFCKREESLREGIERLEKELPSMSREE